MRSRAASYFKWALALALPLLLVALFEVLKGRAALMDTWVNGIMAPVEQFFSRIWAVFPFSVAEVLTVLTLLGALVWLVRTMVLLVLHRKGKPFFRRLLALLSAGLWLWCALCWMWNAAYYAPDFAQKSGLDPQPYSVETLAQVTALFAENAAQLSNQVPRDQEGHFAQDSRESIAQAETVYENISREFSFLDLTWTPAKPLVCSRLQSILGFTGVYFPFTGEANVNVDAPSCLLPATIAHEMAHQRMVADESEANFVGIAACVTSDNAVFQYSGYLMGLIHLCNALYPVDPEAWNAIADQYFTRELATDWNDNNAYWNALSSPVEDAAGQVYDSFLKGNDQQLGLQSYGACVDLLVTYFS